MREYDNQDTPSLTTLSNPSLRTESFVALGTIGVLTASTALVGARASHGNQRWYGRLRKPGFTPPAWVFGPVWTVLYGLMCFSAWRVWNRPAGPKRSWALLWWGVQLGFNALWSPLFFKRHRPGAALADLAALGASLVTYTAVTSKVDRSAAWMMAPYLSWVGYAGALNEELVRLNR